MKKQSKYHYNTTDYAVQHTILSKYDYYY